MSLVDDISGHETEQLAVLFCDISHADLNSSMESEIALWRVNYFRAARELAADYCGREATTALGGWAATFNSTVEALLCARALSSLVGWQLGGPSLSGGLSAGHVTQDRRGIDGSAVREAIALCDQAHPRQILIADPLKVIVAQDSAGSLAPAPRSGSADVQPFDGRTRSNGRTLRLNPADDAAGAGWAGTEPPLRLVQTGRPRSNLRPLPDVRPAGSPQGPQGPQGLQGLQGLEGLEALEGLHGTGFIPHGGHLDPDHATVHGVTAATQAAATQAAASQAAASQAAVDCHPGTTDNRAARPERLSPGHEDLPGIVDHGPGDTKNRAAPGFGGGLVHGNGTAAATTAPPGTETTTPSAIGPPPTEGLRLTVLGWVQLERGEPPTRLAALRGSQARSVLSMLALRAGPVHKDELAELLWPAALPDHWEGALRGLITKVRRFLDAGGLRARDVLVGECGFYELRLPPGVAVDRSLAAALISAAGRAFADDRPREAVRLARRALEILKRRLLSGQDNAWFDQVRAELSRDRLAALELWARADLAGGGVEGAKRAATEALGLDPYRESSYRLLMQAHAAAGSRGEALRTYEQCRTMLAEELGVGPAAQTQALYIRLLG